MSHDMTTHQNDNQGGVSRIPASGTNGSNMAVVQIEQARAIAEAEGKLTLAKKFPRDENRSHEMLMRACKIPAFAETAFYTVKNRGSGPSIRMAEEVARCVGNFDYGHRELSRDDKNHTSVVEVYAWDMELNNESRRQITVDHYRYTKTGRYLLTSEDDILNKISNIAAKHMRSRILALAPKWMIAEAVAEVRRTLTGDSAVPIEVRARNMVQAFSRFGVTSAHIERHLNHKIGEIMIDELADLTGIHNAIRDGANPSEFFNIREASEANKEEAASVAAAIGAGNKEPAKAKATTKAKPKAESAAKDEPAEEPKPKADDTPPPADSDEGDVF